MQPCLRKVQAAEAEGRDVPLVRRGHVLLQGEVLFAESLPCPKCGEELFEMVAPDPILCQRSGKWCAWPCGQGDKPAGSGFADCPYNTPVAKRAENDKVK